MAQVTAARVYPTGDPLPGTKLGAFGRKIKASDLTSFITNYNSTVAGTANTGGPDT